MKQSQLFTKTRREAPSGEESKNAQLLIRAGFINKEMAGVYDYLPLGLRVIKKIENIVREEMNAIGGQEISMSALQNKEVWEKTDRWDDKKVDNWFKTKLKNDTEVGLGFTHEEPLTQIMTDHIKSFRDLPKYAYQFQTKFRNEARAKSGIMRGREFLMKDMYSFCLDEKQHEEFYHKVEEAYKKIFNAVGIEAHEVMASGGSFSDFSHEFQVVSEAGEDIINMSENHSAIINEEIINEPTATKLISDSRTDFKKVKSIEVGNIFSLGTRFSEALGLKYTDESGEQKPVFMGSYGIGVSRLMGTIAEVLSDEKGLIWPEAVAPFDYHLIEINGDKSEVRAKAEEIYKKLSVDKEVLWDDRDLRAGEKFADADLIGIPKQIIISEKALEKQVFEIKDRRTGEIDSMEG